MHWVRELGIFLIVLGFADVFRQMLYYDSFAYLILGIVSIVFGVLIILCVKVKVKKKKKTTRIR